MTTLKKEFGGGEEESVKAAELRKIEQGGKTMEEFVQEEVGMRGGHWWRNSEEADGGGKSANLHRTMV